MNKFLKNLFCFILMAVTFTACSDDPELAPTGPQGNPETEVVGTYNGTWSVDQDGNVTEYEGTITITAESQYIGSMKIVCPGRKIDVECMVNIMKQNPNYRFYNEIETNPLGAQFLGSITPEGKIELVFTKVEKEGRKSFVFTYTFNGNR